MGNRTSVTTAAGNGGIEIDGNGNTLPLGHRLQEYVIEGLIGEGGFGIVYLARDTQLGRVVALKEYMPSSLATRGNDHQVSVRSMRHRETFELGLRSFVNEAQLLASFDHPSLVKVYRFWEQNGTAYMVMPYYQGPTLKQWLVENGARADEGWLLSLLHPIIDALEAMHHERCYHRDIAPDNILLLQHGATQIGRALRPVLLDFGAARRVISDATQALTVILKSGYAPIEQYAESTSMKQGAWTDVYALSAVLYAAITGRAPLPSVSRMVTDDMVPAAQVGAGHYTQEFLAAIDKGLAVRPEHRPQDMAALRQLFSFGVGTPSVAAPAPEPSVSAPSVSGDDGATVLMTPTVAPTVVQPPRPSVPPPPPPPPAAPVAATPVAASPRPAAPVPPLKLLNPDPVPVAPSRTGIYVAGGLGLAVLAVAAWWFGLRDHTPAAAPSAAPVVAGTDASPPVAPPAARGEPPAPPASAVAAPPPAATPFGVVTALQDIVRQADPLLGVNALADKSAIQIGRDRLQFRLKSSQSGYVYVFLAGTDKGHMYLLFPNAIDKDNRIDANKELTLPRKGWQITAGGPPGTNHIVTMVSRLPRDFSQAGLRASKDDIPEFDLARAEQLWLARTGRENPFVGQAVCPAQGACDGTYGASLLTIDEVR